MSKMKYNPLTGDFDYVNEGGDLTKPDIVFIPSWNDREYLDHNGYDMAIVRLEPNRIVAMNEPIISTIREVVISFPNAQFSCSFEFIFRISDIRPPIIDFPPTIFWDSLPVFESNKLYRIKVDRYANADNYVNIGSFTVLQLT